ncbi:MAG TPA: hypothetical protein VGF68_11475 [Solirubrobacteraceae bacterium]
MSAVNDPSADNAPAIIGAATTGRLTGLTAGPPDRRTAGPPDRRTIKLLCQVEGGTPMITADAQLTVIGTSG